MNLEAQFIQLIHNRYGLVTHVDQAGALTKTIKDACKEFHLSPQEYLQQLQSCPNNSPLLAFLIAGITVGESYFFRDLNQINLLRKILLPRLIERKKEAGDYAIKIWSAGCSAGEEIYTVAILLYELLENLKIWNLQLLGTDINRKALEQAAAGIYTKWSMRGVKMEEQSRYFVKKERHYELIPAIRKLVSFKYLNLMDKTYQVAQNYDIIICRNVLIYFNDINCGEIIKKLSTYLSPDGFFIFGASDPIMITENHLVFHHEEDAIYFTQGTQS